MALGLTLALAAGHATALDASQVFEKNKGSVGTVRTPAALGSGVVIAPFTVLTNCHVVAGQREITFGQGAKTHAATLIEGSTSFDLCKLRVPTLEAKPASIRGITSIRIGERVFAIGNPKGFELTLSEGLVSGLRDIENEVQIQTTAPISHGSSGGGLFDAAGQLIGITTSGRTDGQGLNFAMPASLASHLQPMDRLEAFDESRRLTPEKLDRLAAIVEKQDLDSMLAESAQWMQDDSGSAFALTLAAMALLEFDQDRSAEALLLRALSLRPTFTPALWTLAAHSLKKSDAAKSTRYLQQCVEVADAANSLTISYRALCRAKQGDSTALEAIDVLIQEYPRRSWLRLVAAQGWLLLKQPEKASLAAQASIGLNSESALALTASASALAMMQRFDEATPQIERAVLLSPRSPAVLEVAAILSAVAQKQAKKNEYFARLTAVSPARSARLTKTLPKLFAPQVERP